MYYLLKDGRIIDTKDYLGCQYGDDRNILYIEYNEDGLPISKRVLEQEYEAKSENLLDLARADDSIELRDGSRYQIINYSATGLRIIIDETTEYTKSIYDLDVVALWKHRGNIMERHEVGK